MWDPKWEFVEILCSKHLLWNRKTFRWNNSVYREYITGTGNFEKALKCHITDCIEIVTPWLKIRNTSNGSRVFYMKGRYMHQLEVNILHWYTQQAKCHKDQYWHQSGLSFVSRNCLHISQDSYLNMFIDKDELRIHVKVSKYTSKVFSDEVVLRLFKLTPTNSM